MHSSSLGNIFDTLLTRDGRVIDSANESRSDAIPIVYLASEKLEDNDRLVRNIENSFASKYDTDQWRTDAMQYIAQTDTRLLEEWFTSIGNTLEIGPGTGRIALALALTSKGTIYGIDTSEEFLKVLRQKAIDLNLNQDKIKLGVGDIQYLSDKALKKFVTQPLDTVLIWFGTFAFLTTNPDHVLEISYNATKPTGEILINTYSPNALMYTLVEQRRRRDNRLPLGYQPGMYTQRAFKNDSAIGLKLGNGDILPCKFYSPSDMTEKLKDHGYELTDLRGISCVTALYPAFPNKKNIQLFTEIIHEEFPELANQIEHHSNDHEKIWEIVQNFDLQFARSKQDPEEVSKCTYICYRAKKI